MMCVCVCVLVVYNKKNFFLTVSVFLLCSEMFQGYTSQLSPHGQCNNHMHVSRRKKKEEDEKSQQPLIAFDVDNTLVTTIDGDVTERITDVHGIPIDHEPLTLYNAFFDHTHVERDGARTILNQLKEKYRIGIVSLATAQHIHDIVHMLDPNGDIFEQRIVSREELPAGGTKKHIPNSWNVDEKNVIVVDDTISVWTGNVTIIRPVPFVSGRHILDVEGTLSAVAQHIDCSLAHYNKNMNTLSFRDCCLFNHCNENVRYMLFRCIGNRRFINVGRGIVISRFWQPTIPSWISCDHLVTRADSLSPITTTH